jgi:antitoxin component of MazEF toxin-antitoxin module
VIGLEGEGEITKVTVNSSKRKSLRSTIPMSVVKNMGLKVGDNLSWKYEIRNGEIVTTIRKTKTSNKR